MQRGILLLRGAFFILNYGGTIMLSLNDYLYSGDTVLKILHCYSDDLRENGIKNHNQIDLVHSNFLIRISELLQHNEFLTSQSQRILEFYKFMAREYPFLAFTLKGRIKSLIRAEEKFNGKIVGLVYKHYLANGTFPSLPELKDKLSKIRDLIAYRFVISLPRCHLAQGQNRESEEIKYLYELANALPEILEEHGFASQLASSNTAQAGSPLCEDVRPYYKDYIFGQKEAGYRSLHITLYDNLSRSFAEVQLRTKDMDDFAEIGPANHLGYEKRQEAERARRYKIPVGECQYFDEAYERGMMLQKLDLSKIDVNMFSAVDNSLINDGCGLFRGRLILPYEHLSRFQNDLID